MIELNFGSWDIYTEKVHVKLFQQSLNQWIKLFVTGNNFDWFCEEALGVGSDHRKAYLDMLLKLQTIVLFDTCAFS